MEKINSIKGKHKVLPKIKLRILEVNLSLKNEMSITIKGKCYNNKKFEKKGEFETFSPGLP